MAPQKNLVEPEPLSQKISSVSSATMTEDDDDSYRTTAAEETPPYMNLRKRPPLQLRPLQTMRSNKKKSCTTATIKSQLPLTLRRLEPMQRCDVDRNLSLRVLSASLTMQRDYLVMKSKKKGKKVRPPAIRSRIFRCLVFHQILTLQS